MGRGGGKGGRECVYRGRVPWSTQVPVRLKVTSAGREKGADRVVLIGVGQWKYGGNYIGWAVGGVLPDGWNLMDNRDQSNSLDIQLSLGFPWHYPHLSLSPRPHRNPLVHFGPLLRILAVLRGQRRSRPASARSRQCWPEIVIFVHTGYT